MKHLFIYIFYLCLLSVCVHARPISYPGAWTVMQKNNWESSRLHVHYSPKKTYSVGSVIEYFHNSHHKDILAQLNYLVKRKNTPYTQANIYAKTSIGAKFTPQKQHLVYQASLDADWESRRYFSSFSTRFSYVNAIDAGSFHHHARIGIAPYVADYGNLHTWFMLQADFFPQSLANSFEGIYQNNQLIISALCRFFKGIYLFEIGINENKDLLLNWIVRL